MQFVLIDVITGEFMSAYYGKVVCQTLLEIKQLLNTVVICVYVSACVEKHLCILTHLNNQK